MGTLAGRTVIVTGASRGIGRAIALRAAREGANVVVAAKTVESSTRFQGTIHDVAREVEAAGGQALAVQVDVREADRIDGMVEQAVARFGGVDVLVHNAGAITLRPVEEMPLRRFDLLVGVNVRAGYACARACIPHLKKSANGHILNISPPVDLAPRWIAGRTGYTISKYGLTMLTLGLAEELRPAGVAANSLWPRTTIATAAVRMLGGEALAKASRTPEIMADAAHAIVTSPAREVTGQCFVDEALLRSRGVTDFGKYAVAPGTELAPDLYIE